MYKLLIIFVLILSYSDINAVQQPEDPPRKKLVLKKEYQSNFQPEFKEGDKIGLTLKNVKRKFA